MKIQERQQMTPIPFICTPIVVFYIQDGFTQSFRIIIHEHENWYTKK
jgi:hypothetical protein